MWEEGCQRRFVMYMSSRDMLKQKRRGREDARVRTIMGHARFGTAEESLVPFVVKMF
jgi:hypothetical protein